MLKYNNEIRVFLVNLIHCMFSMPFKKTRSQFQGRIMNMLRSLDVWDTLIRRSCHPEFLKLGTARHVFLHSGIQLKEICATSWDIYKLRVEAEATLANEALALGHDNEYEISNVLRRWLEEITMGGFDNNLPDYLADLELEAEMRCTYPDPSIREFLNVFPSNNTIFLSDFYMCSERLKRLLSYHGLNDLVSDGVSSCDVMLNKRSGNLFQYIHKKYGISPAEHLHIGDSLHSDVEMPRRLGIQAIHFESEVEHKKRQDVAVFFSDRGALMRHIEQEVDRASNLWDNELNDKEAFRLGTKMAPLFVGFVLFIAESAIRGSLGKIFFFTREGEFFLKVWQTLFKDSRLVGHKLPQVEILEVSRFSTFCASLQEVSIAEIMRLWSLYRVHSLDSLLASLGLTTVELYQVFLRHGIDPVESIKHPWDDARVQKLFQDSEFMESLQAKIRHDRPLLQDYLNQKGLTLETREAGVVDIGWRGSIQDNLCFLLPNCQIRGFYLGLQKYLNNQPRNSSKQAYGPNANVNSEFADLLDPVSVLEMLCSSQSGSVKAYQKTPSGEIVAERFQGTELGQDAAEFSRNFQQGVLSACAVWSQYVSTHVITSLELRMPACSLWRNLEQTSEILFAKKT
jgi:FMN phosphatase YigB (HAD superfamily)